MANCSDSTYVIYYTDSSKGTIQIAKSVLDVSSLDIALIGKTRIEYGEIFNENLLHILENFAAPNSVVAHNVPDPSFTTAATLERPVVGQFWFNNNLKQLYVRAPDNATGFWKGLHSNRSVFGSSGTVQHGQTIPVPNSVRPVDCSFTVSPFFYQNSNLRSYNVSVDTNGVVTALYVNAGGTSLPGIANYIALVVYNNTNNGSSEICDPAPPMISPTPTPTPSVSIGASVTPTPSPAVTIAPSVTPTSTVAPSPSSSPAPGVTVTPSPTSTMPPTPTSTVTPTPSSTPAPGVTVTPTPTPTPQPSASPAQASPSPTPQPSATPTATAATTPTPTVTPTVSASNTTISTTFVTESSFSMPLDFPFNSGEARLSFGSDYSVSAGNSDTLDTPTGTFWLNGTAGNASLFRIRYDITSFDPPTVNATQLIGSAPATWHTGGMSIIMQADNEQIMGGSAGQPGTIQFNITIQRISNPADQVIVAGSVAVTSGIV